MVVIAALATSIGLSPDVDMPDPHASSPLEGEPPSEWVPRAAAGDRSAFERLHERFAPGLMRFILKRVDGNADLAEELAHLTWIAAWDALRQGKFDSQRGAFSTFLYGVGSKYWLRHRRDARTDARITAAIGQAQSPAHASPADPAGTMAFVELLQDVRDLLFGESGPQTLSPEEREVLLESARGTSERDLAARLRLAPSTINARKQSGYAKMRRALIGRGWNEESVEHCLSEIE